MILSDSTFSPAPRDGDARDAMKKQVRDDVTTSAINDFDIIAFNFVFIPTPIQMKHFT